MMPPSRDDPTLHFLSTYVPVASDHRLFHVLPRRGQHDDVGQRQIDRKRGEDDSFEGSGADVFEDLKGEENSRETSTKRSRLPSRTGREAMPTSRIAWASMSFLRPVARSS